MNAVMSRAMIMVLIVPLALTLSGCVPQIPSPAPTPVATSRVGGFRVETVAEGLTVPWALAFAPDGRLFFTERPGRLRMIENDQLRTQPLATFEVAQAGEGGLLGLALDPDFSVNRLGYAYYTYQSNGQLFNRVVRFSISDEGIGEITTILDGIPAASIHDGGRIKFGPDGKLYVTTGDATDADQAQNRESLAGKILRVNSDGSLPSDNPSPRSPLYTFGHRNSQGLAWHPVTGQLFATEHGPTGHDEVNIIEADSNYGWPEVAGPGGEPRFVDPIAEYHPAIAPAGAAFWADAQLAEWNNSLFFGALRGQHLHRIALAAPEYRQVQNQERLLDGQYGRLRDVVLGPDNLLYFTTSNRDGRGNPASNDDRILRIVPE